MIWVIGGISMGYLWDNIKLMKKKCWKNLINKVPGTKKNVFFT